MLVLIVCHAVLNHVQNIHFLRFQGVGRWYFHITGQSQIRLHLLTLDDHNSMALQSYSKQRIFSFCYIQIAHAVPLEKNTSMVDASFLDCGAN